jgi:RecG-like helicase
MLATRGKRTTVVCTAIARELTGFMWAVAREAQAIKSYVAEANLHLAHGRRRDNGRGTPVRRFVAGN